MADVFLLYDRSDWAWVKHISDAVESAGYSVAWLPEFRPDVPIDLQVQQALSGAVTLIVLWSPASVGSDDVKAISRLAMDLGKLISVRLPDFLPNRVPLHFQTHQIESADDIPKILVAISTSASSAAPRPSSARVGGAVGGIGPAGQVSERRAGPAKGADVFVSYARSDWPVAGSLVSELKSRGYSVWWDRDLVAGKDFQSQIREELDAAGAVVAIWSKRSAASAWVIGEASRALESGKLVSTRFPDFRVLEIERDFQQQRVDVVDDLLNIEQALSAKNVRPSLFDSIVKPPYGNKITEALDIMRSADLAQISFFLPLMLLIFAVGVGIGFIAIADGIGIGIVNWTPQGASSPNFVKEVGYNWALNWSLTSVLILPMAWALVVLTLETLADVKRQMVSRQMIVTAEFEPILKGDPRLVRLIRDVSRVIAVLITTVVGLIIVFSWWDFHSVVYRVYADSEIARTFNDISPGAPLPLDDHKLERDWSVAAFLDRQEATTTDIDSNKWFSLIVYLIYPGIGVGALFAYFMVLVGLGAMIMPRSMQRYGLQIIPDVDSTDHRRGFEAFAGLFANSLSITALCFCCCYLMLVQNIYLRVETSTLVEFLTPNVSAAVTEFGSGNLGKALDHLIGNSFDRDIPYGAIQSVLAWFVFMFMFMVLFGIAYLFLRASAEKGRRDLRAELDRFGPVSLLKITELPSEEIRARLSSMTVWPLGWPRVNLVLTSYVASFLGLIFYKLGLLLAVTAVIFAAYNLYRESAST